MKRGNSRGLSLQVVAEVTDGTSETGTDRVPAHSWRCPMARYTTTLDRASVAPPEQGGRTRGRRLLGMLLGLVLATAVTGGGAIALLTAIAYNSPGQSISSGKLSLSLADNGAGFTQS